LISKLKKKFKKLKAKRAKEQKKLNKKKKNKGKKGVKKLKKDDKQFENLDDNLLSGSGNDMLMESQQEGDQKVGVHINHLQSESLS